MFKNRLKINCGRFWIAGLFGVVFSSLVLAVGNPQSVPVSLTGTVIVIDSGNSFVLFAEKGEQYKVRLAGTVSPRLGQPYGAFAKSRLGDLLIGQTVVVTRHGKSTKEIHGQVTVEGLDVAHSLVSDGYLWVMRDEGSNALLVQAEEKAKMDKRGLWGIPGRPAVHPDEWESYLNSRSKDPWYGQFFRMCKRLVMGIFE